MGGSLSEDCLASSFCSGCTIIECCQARVKGCTLFSPNVKASCRSQCLFVERRICYINITKDQNPVYPKHFSNQKDVNVVHQNRPCGISSHDPDFRHKEMFA